MWNSKRRPPLRETLIAPRGHDATMLQTSAGMLGMETRRLQAEASGDAGEQHSAAA